VQTAADAVPAGISSPASPILVMPPHQARRKTPLEMPDGTVIQPTGKPFDILYSTAARWRDDKIIEEYLFYDNGTFLKQIGFA
jgi:hypothetical protein